MCTRRGCSLQLRMLHEAAGYCRCVRPVQGRLAPWNAAGTQVRRGRAYFADGCQVGGDGPLKVAGGNRQSHCQVSGRLREQEAAHHIGVAVHRVQTQPSMLGEHCHDEVHAVAVNAIGYSQRRSLALHACEHVSGNSSDP